MWKYHITLLKTSHNALMYVIVIYEYKAIFLGFSKAKNYEQ